MNQMPRVLLNVHTNQSIERRLPHHLFLSVWFF